MKRWLAAITYRTANGPLPVEHDIEELGEIEELVERGPHWDAISSIVITKQRTPVEITIEEAAAS